MSLHLSKCHIVGNHMSLLKLLLYNNQMKHFVIDLIIFEQRFQLAISFRLMQVTISATACIACSNIWVVGILTFISMINTISSEIFKARSLYFSAF